MDFCQYCGAELVAESSFCPKCAKSISKEQAVPSKISRPTGVTILAILQVIAGIILAIFSFIIAGALFSGKGWARGIVIVFSIIDLILSLGSTVGNVFAIVDVILNLVILYYMWRPHVIAHFRART